jgi:YegS/Rv2252/BmrU family lipid kinase
MKIVFVVNNKNNRLVKVIQRIDQYFLQSELGTVKITSTIRKKHAIELARQATESDCDYLIAVGGDGTLNEVINGMMQSKIPINEHPVIGLLPYGSANDFARTAGISNSIKELIDLIQSKSIQKLDLGKIYVENTKKTSYFINIAGVGLGPEIVQKIERSSNVFGSKINYFKHILKGFLSYDKKEVSCTSDTWQWKGKLLQMAVANGRYFGNAICVAPEANLIDGRFQVTVFGDLSIWDYLKNIGKLKKGVKINHPQVHYHIAKEITIASENSCGIEADGEYVGMAPAVIRVLPNNINFLITKA